MTPPRHPPFGPPPPADRPTGPYPQPFPLPPVDRPTGPYPPFPPPPVDRPTGHPTPGDVDPPDPGLPDLPPWQSPPLFPDGRPPEQPSGRAGEVTGVLEAAVDRLRAALKELADAFNRCADAVGKVGGALADVLFAGILAALERVRTIIEAVLRVGRYVLEHYAPLIALIVTAFSWLDHVARPATAIAEQAVESGIDLFDWEGKAADYYRARLDSQQTAATEVADTAVKVGGWLLHIAQDNVGYTQRLTELVISLAAAVAQAAVEASTIVGIPSAIDTLKDEIGTIVEGVGSHVAASVTRLMETLGRVHEIDSVRATHTGNWPQMVVG